MKRIAFTTLLLALLAVGCKKQHELSHREAARLAAQQYYTYLINGQYESFANGMYVVDSMPADYRAQLADASAQYALSETSKRGGLVGVTVVSDSLNADSVSGYVCLELTFGDQTTETIALPLVLTAEGWKMR